MASLKELERALREEKIFIEEEYGSFTKPTCKRPLKLEVDKEFLGCMSINFIGWKLVFTPDSYFVSDTCD